MELVVLPVAGATLIGGVLFVLRRAEARLGGGLVEAWLFAMALTIAVSGGALLLFYLVVSLTRHGGNYPVFVAWTRRAFILICVLAPPLSGVFGHAMGRSIAGRGAVVSVAAALGTTLGILICAPLLEFFNACNVGQPYFLAIGC